MERILRKNEKYKKVAQIVVSELLLIANGIMLIGC